MEKVLEYMAFRKTYEDAGPKEEVPVNEFMERLPPEVALELLVHRAFSLIPFPPDCQYLILVRLLLADYLEGMSDEPPESSPHG